MGVAVRRVSRNYVCVNQPLVAQRYNQHYKAIDLFDQHMAAYPVSRRTYRSWKHIFWFCFQASVINSYIIYRETNLGPLPKTYSHIDFRISLAKQLIGNFSTRQVNPITRPLFVGPDAPNEQLMNHQNTKLEPPTIRVCRPHKQYHGVTKRSFWLCNLSNVHLQTMPCSLAYSKCTINHACKHMDRNKTFVLQYIFISIIHFEQFYFVCHIWVICQFTLISLIFYCM